MNTTDHPPAESPTVGFELTPPEVITPLATAAARSAVPLPAPTVAAVDQQVRAFVDGLMNEDLHSEAFRARLDSAFALGKEEVSIAAGLMQGKLLQRNFLDMESHAAFRAIQDLRGHLDALNPGAQGNLLQPNRILGIFPFGNKLQAYFRRYQSASSQLNSSLEQIYAARDNVQRDVVDIEATRAKLWDAMQKLAGAIHFAERLDASLSSTAAQLQATDPDRAQALQQEVLFYARQNLTDMLTQQTVCTNGYLALDVLKKTGRELINGCTRVATTGMSALAVAQTVARATGNQVQVMTMLQGVNATIGSLISEGGRQLGNHVDATAEFAANPMIGIEKIKEMFDQTFRAMDAMDSFRSKAIDAMGQNNAVMKEQLARAEAYVDRTREKLARAAARAALPGGPVTL